jgi:uncharacterized protein (DUF1800 family)
MSAFSSRRPKNGLLFTPEFPAHERLSSMRMFRLRFLAMPALILAASTAAATPVDPTTLAMVNRTSWGAQAADVQALADQGISAWLDAQLHPSDEDGLPQAVRDQIASMEISQKSLVGINNEVRSLQKVAQTAKGTPDYDAAQKAYQGKLNDLAREAQMRSLLRDLYSRNQLKEQLTWFWVNHFNVHQNKGEIRAFIGDYEETIRDHALGRFRDLLISTMTHPAMLQYLDNVQNAKDHINENYARELMELHTLGVGSGYTQQDVQELARILTGMGVNSSGTLPNVPVAYASRYRYKGLFEFNPQRHDFGDKHFLGSDVEGRGIEEVALAATDLSLQPPTAMHISRELAEYFCCDQPSDRLVQAMAATFRAQDGEISAVLRTLFNSPEFRASLGHKFKDPIHYVLSSVRAAYSDRPAINLVPVTNWLNRMGEPLYGHETPDGYAMDEASWSGPGQMETRFEFAHQLGHGNLPIFTPPAPPTPPPTPGADMIATPQPAPVRPQPAPPTLLEAAQYQAIAPTLSAGTTNALNQATNPGDKTMLFLASPEFMYR